MTSTLIEFAVQMTCESCERKVRNALRDLKEIEKLTISVDNGTVLVETSLPSSIIQDRIESTGMKAVLKGFGSSKDGISNKMAAVAMLGGNTGYGAGSVRGIVRFVQLDDSLCVVEGTVDGLDPGEHGLHVNECGDITNGCDSTGEHFNLKNTNHGAPDADENNRHTGDLGNIKADSDGRATFRLVDRVLKVWDIIGRSIVVTAGRDDLGLGSTAQSPVDGNSGERLACGIISRSAGVFENSKKICACDGLTLWDEREKPTTAIPSIPSSSLCTYL
ncbi:copper chaperone for superoxide dismutase [Nilaparvata lugens]|uniref:Extracellular superoxide dismutase [Cu-Zn] n=1 Tax=Nilaparvata lugens TaxID=108931 RepID=A0A2K8FTM4_NILLU|nr:copper chaperone for superoxide dismutase [Nilaparvata lugens]AQW43017.1 copper chaperone for superoxide dismutase [Nilaparvata lugens]